MGRENLMVGCFLSNRQGGADATTGEEHEAGESGILAESSPSMRNGGFGGASKDGSSKNPPKVTSPTNGGPPKAEPSPTAPKAAPSPASSELEERVEGSGL